MARYPIQDARRYIVQAFMRLNKIRKINLSLIDLHYSDLHGWNFIKATMYDKDSKIKFDSMLNEFIFNHDEAMSSLDSMAGIKGKNLNKREITILRIAYTIWLDWNKAKNDTVN